MNTSIPSNNSILSDVSTLTLNTEDIGLHLHEETELVLNCTYQKESNEEIGDKDIRWQKWIENAFKDVGFFSPPGGEKPFLEGEIESLYNNRTKFIAPTDGSVSAVLILKEYVMMWDYINAWLIIILTTEIISQLASIHLLLKLKLYL